MLSRHANCRIIQKRTRAQISHMPASNIIYKPAYHSPHADATFELDQTGVFN